MNQKKLADLLCRNKRLLLDVADQLPALLITEYHRGIVYSRHDASIDQLINQSEYVSILINIVKDMPSSDNKVKMYRSLELVECAIASFSFK